jgi:hypothetical protein
MYCKGRTRRRSWQEICSIQAFNWRNCEESVSVPRLETGIPQIRIRNAFNSDTTRAPTLPWCWSPRDLSFLDCVHVDEAAHGTRVAEACNAQAIRPRASDLVRTLRSASQQARDPAGCQVGSACIISKTIQTSLSTSSLLQWLLIFR